jgi:hypothetical protein
MCGDGCDGVDRFYTWLLSCIAVYALLFMCCCFCVSFNGSNESWVFGFAFVFISFSCLFGFLTGSIATHHQSYRFGIPLLGRVAELNCQRHKTNWCHRCGSWL